MTAWKRQSDRDRNQVSGCEGLGVGGRAQRNFWGGRDIPNLDYGGGYPIKTYQIVHLTRMTFTVHN